MAITHSYELPHNIIGFVSDSVSEQVINNYIQDHNISFAEVVQGNMDDILEFLKNNRSPKVLIMDISNSELPLSDIVKIKENSTPNINIVAIGSKNDVGLFRDLIDAGVSDYVLKPLNNNVLRNALDKANGVIKLSHIKSGKMVQFISSVGGAGATTVATNVAWILANRHFKRTLLMDIDFTYGTSNLMLDIKTENAYLDLLESPDKIDDYFVSTMLRKHGDKLYHLGGLVDLIRGVHVDMDAFQALLRAVKAQFNYVLVDSQRDISEINKSCMDESNSFVVMVEMSIASAQNTTRILEFLESSQQGKKVILVANKVGLSVAGSLTREAFESVINRKIDYIIPIEEIATLAAANIGQPVVMADTPLTPPLENIADDIMGKRENVGIIKQLEQDKWDLDGIQNRVIELYNNVMKLVNK